MNWVKAFSNFFLKRATLKHFSNRKASRQNKYYKSKFNAKSDSCWWQSTCIKAKVSRNKILMMWTARCHYLLTFSKYSLDPSGFGFIWKIKQLDNTKGNVHSCILNRLTTYMDWFSWMHFSFKRLLRLTKPHTQNHMTPK